MRNCNTLIIEDAADRMGLAPAVPAAGAGWARSGPQGPTPTSPSAGTRPCPTSRRSGCPPIREFTAFGSGFRIAHAGPADPGARATFWGHSQHGHMEAVGYDLYMKMLNQAIAAARGEPVLRGQERVPGGPAGGRLYPRAVYPRRAPAGSRPTRRDRRPSRTPPDAADVLDELIDRYGDPPASVSDLVNVSLVRILAASVGRLRSHPEKGPADPLAGKAGAAHDPRPAHRSSTAGVTAGAGGPNPTCRCGCGTRKSPWTCCSSFLQAMAAIQD